jgi:hypothetical protein
MRRLVTEARAHATERVFLEETKIRCAGRAVAPDEDAVIASESRSDR